MKEHPHNTWLYLDMRRLERLEPYTISRYAKKKLKEKLSKQKRLSVKEIQKAGGLKKHEKLRLLRHMLSRKQEWLLACALAERVLENEKEEGRDTKAKLIIELEHAREAIKKGEYQKTRRSVNRSSGQVGDSAWGLMTDKRKIGDFKGAHAARIVALSTESFGYRQVFDYILDYEMLRMEFPSRDGKGEKEKELISDIVNWILHGVLSIHLDELERIQKEYRS